MLPLVIPITQQHDEISTTNTEGSLIGSRTSTGIGSTVNKEAIYCCPDKNDRKCKQRLILVTGIAFVLWGVGNLIYPPFDLLMDQRIRMTPGLPAFEWWIEIPDQVIMKVYMFNITNSVEFLSGVDKKIKVTEVGPIIYREQLIQKNPVFNDNGTLTYTANRTAEFLPEMNSIDLNSTIIMPNLGVLFIPAYFHDASFFVKMAINMMLRKTKSSPFVTTTIHNYLWNISDPMLEAAQNIAPFLVPTKNVGILDRVYSELEDNVTVYIGPQHGHKKFFLIDRFDGSEYLPNRESNCADKVVGSSEGVSYPQYLTKNDSLRYWRKTLCMVGNLHYEREVQRLGLTAYEYVLAPTTYYRTYPPEDDCYRGSPTLPDGLADVSACYFDTSVAASFPHYLYGEEKIKNYVEGLQPDIEKHKSYVLVEPYTGLPLHGVARSQINLVIRNMKGFNEKIRRLSDISIPLVWIEYNQVGIPWYVHYLTYFTVVLVPILQVVLTVFLFVGGSWCFIYFYLQTSKQSKNLNENKKLKFETEFFLKS